MQQSALNIVEYCNLPSDSVNEHTSTMPVFMA